MDMDPPPLISADDWVATPPAVQALLRELMDMVRTLSVEVQDLRIRVNQTSKNSSQPPSSDPPSAPPPPARRASGRKRGAQPGHADQQRPLLPPDQVHAIVTVQPSACPVCHATWSAQLPDAAPTLCTQVVELPPMTAHITEYRLHTVCCPACTTLVTAPRPADMPPGCFGPRLTALVGLLHGRYRLSTRETAAFLAEVSGITISQGSIVMSCTRLSTALEGVDAAIQSAVQHQAHLHVDETSWREQQQRGWLWVAVSPIATCFRIDARRSRHALQRLIGDTYPGIVHSDRGSAYHAVPNTHRQLCWAHLMRNLQGLVDHGHADSWWAHRMLVQARAVFTAWHAYRCTLFDRPALQQALLPVRLALAELLQHSAMAVWTKLRKFARDLQRHWDALWTFSRVEGVEPTNNVAERALRPAVLWRKQCFGTQSATGSRFVERLLSVRATCAQQGRNLFAFLTEAVMAAWRDRPAPLLVPIP